MTNLSLSETDLVYTFNPVMLTTLLTVGGDKNFFTLLSPTTVQGVLDIFNSALQADMPLLPIINIFGGMWQPMGIMLREFHKLYNPRYTQLANDPKAKGKFAVCIGILILFTDV